MLSAATVSFGYMAGNWRLMVFNGESLFYLGRFGIVCDRGARAIPNQFLLPVFPEWEMKKLAAEIFSSGLALAQLGLMA